MGIVAPVITTFFDLDSNDGTLFTVEDPTLGLLDTGGVLGGDLASDVTGFGFAITVNRGRSFELDEINAGTARIVFRNQDRVFDPSNADGDFYGNLVPGKRVEVSIYGQKIFTGVAEEWADGYQVGAASDMSLLCVDALGQLARCEFDEWTTTSQLPGDRIGDVLDRNDVRYGGGRDIDEGVETLQADNVSWGSNVLNYLQLVSRSDQGRLFASRSGVLTFRDRLSIDGVNPVLTFADDGSGYAFSAVAKRSASEMLYTSVSIDREGGTAQTVTDTDGATAYGLRRLSTTGLLLDTDTRSLELANYLLSIYSMPTNRIASLTVIVSALDDQADQALISSLEIGDVVTVVWTPDSVGDPIDAALIVEGVAHNIEVNGVHTMTLALSDVFLNAPFILEDDELGLLDDGGVLSF